MGEWGRAVRQLLFDQRRGSSVTTTRSVLILKGLEVLLQGTFCWSLINLDQGSKHVVSGIVLRVLNHFRSEAMESQQT